MNRHSTHTLGLPLARGVAFALLAMLVAACGTDDRHFKIEGRFANMNQGELYVYSLDGETGEIDTIPVSGGRFAYEVWCEVPQTFMMVFPNYSEQPIFGTPGKGVTIKADASHLKDMEVKGTPENELMGKFRKQTSEASPPQLVEQARQFIGQHPESVVSAWLLRHYFVETPHPDYKAAASMAAKLSQSQPKNGALINMQRAIESLARTQEKAKLPAFSVRDLNGNTVTAAHFSGKTGVVYAWAVWNYESTNMQRQLKQLQRKHGANRLAIMGISLDPSRSDCRKAAQRDSVGWPIVCDGQLFQSTAVSQLGIVGVPDNMIIDKNGRIVARGLNTQALIDRLKKEL